MEIHTKGRQILFLQCGKKRALKLILNSKKKKFAYLTLTTCSSMFFFITKWFYANFRDMGESLQFYFIGYFVVCAFISLAYCYYRGPISDPRAINLVEWFIKLSGVLCIYSGTAYREMSISVILGILVCSICLYLRTIDLISIGFLDRFR